MTLTKRSNGGMARKYAAVIACTGAIVLACAAPGWTQAFFEASGQTTVFSLSAGVNAIGGKAVARIGSKSTIGIGMAKAGIVVTLSAQRHGPADIAICDMTGRLAYRQRGFCGSVLRLDTRLFAPGVYNVRVYADGQNYSRRLAVSR